MRAKALVVVALGAVLIGGSAVVAHERVTLDPDDSAGPLDVVAAQWRHGRTDLKLRMVTYEAWPDSVLSGDLNYVRFDLDRPHRGGVERCIVVHLDPGQDGGPAAGEAILYKNCDAPLPYSKKIGVAERVTRPDGHSIKVFVKKKALWKHDPEQVRFRVLTSYEDGSHPECQPPDPVPPEHFIGTCSDVTRWRRH